MSGLTGQEKQGRNPPRPGPWLRIFFRLPVCLYRLRLGWVLGRRFIMITHLGRRTGRVHRTVVEVVKYEKLTRESAVLAAYGPRSDWYRNIKAHPALEAQTGRDRYVPDQRDLTPEEAFEVLKDYRRRHPRTLKALLRAVPIIQYDGSDESLRRMAEKVPFVAFRPKTP